MATQRGICPVCDREYGVLNEGVLMAKTIHLCGGDYRPEPRSACPSPVHDWPLPHGYVDADEVAHSRLNRGWKSAQCSRCGLYGWQAGRINPTTDHHVPATQPTDTTET